MRIGIDYTAAVQQGAGIGRYTRNLVRALAALDSRNRYTLFLAGGWGEGDGLGGWPANFRRRSVPLSDRWMHILWQRLHVPVPIQLFTGPLDLYHSPDFVLPPTARTPAILTVHDLSFLRFPQFFVAGFRKYLEAAVSRAVKNAQHILADSESTRKDLVELMDVASTRVSVLYPGVEPRFRPVKDTELLHAVRRRYALPERFILGLSTLQPRKNFDGLIKSFHKLSQQRRAHPETENLHLVIGGGKGWMYEDILALVKRLRLEGRVHFPGFVADQDLPILYSLASVFAFPSWYEGFGLPVLEAMACGTPVVAANNSSLPEVVGQAGIMVDAGDTDALCETLGELVCNDLLRLRLVAAGHEQASLFTWKEAAERLLSVYEACQ